MAVVNLEHCNNGPKKFHPPASIQAASHSASRRAHPPVNETFGAMFAPTLMGIQTQKSASRWQIGAQPAAGAGDSPKPG
jgi:hypothetical protein